MPSDACSQEIKACLLLEMSIRQGHVHLSCKHLTDGRTLLRSISDEELDKDPAANLLTSASEEAQKVARNEGKVCNGNTHTVHAGLLHMQ